MFPLWCSIFTHRFISSDEGARHMCTTMGACHPKQRAWVDLLSFASDILRCIMITHPVQDWFYPGSHVTSALLAWSGSRRTLRTPSSRWFFSRFGLLCLMFLSKSCFSDLNSFQLLGGGSSLPRAQLVRPTSPRRTLHWDAAAPLHPDARDGDGEVHDPHGHLQHPVRGLQPRLDHQTSYPSTSLYSPTSNTSSHVILRSRNKLCMHDISTTLYICTSKSTSFVVILPSS